MTVPGCLLQVARLAVESCAYDVRVEPQPRSRSVAEPDRVQLVCVLVDPGALHAEFAREGRGIHETTADVRSIATVDQLDNALRDGLHVGAVEGPLYVGREIGVRWLSIGAIHSLLLTGTC